MQTSNIIYTQTIKWKPFSKKHKVYIRKAMKSKMSVAEGAVRCGKTIDHCIIAAAYLEQCPDKIHLVSGSSLPNAKLNVGDCNGFGLEYLFRGRCKWGKYKENDALFIQTLSGEKIVIFAGGGKADSYKKILGNSYGLWLATEVNEHYDCDDSRTSFIKVAMARQVAALRPMILWDLNPSNPTARIYTDYIDKYASEGLLGGYNYEHFTIADNLAISEQRKQEIISQYGDVNSIWYRRDILGVRCNAEGLIYEIIANKRDDFLISDEEFKEKYLPTLSFITIGQDFGGNKSAHTIVATAYGKNFNWVIPLMSERIPAKNLDPKDLEDRTELFIVKLRGKYGYLKAIEDYCDSAEQTLINGIRKRMMHNTTGVLVKNALKHPIVDRIKLITKLAYAGVIKWHEDAMTSYEAMASCIYDNRAGHEDERLDNGTTDIDSCDATEYSIEPYTQQLLIKLEVRK